MNRTTSKQYLKALQKKNSFTYYWMITQFPFGMQYKDMNIWVEVNLTFKFENKMIYIIFGHFIIADST